MSEESVDLGFAEPCGDSWKLLSHFFPSKLGGPPAWLNLSQLPGYEDLKCSNCSRTCKFLLQLYSPDSNDSDGDGEEIEDEAFHRTLFLFVCAEEGCNKRSFKCYRSQLPRLNEFYSSEPPNEEEFDETGQFPQATDFSSLCQVCHCSASKTCSKCKAARYCSKEHQLLHWRNGHRVNCSKEELVSSSSSRYFFDEYDIVVEPEDVSKPDPLSGEVLKDYKNVIHKTGADASVTGKDWATLPEAKVTDQAFLDFRERIATEPSQIIRYKWGGVPLLVSDEEVPQSIPNCELCGGERQFEFQVMPQTLSYLNMDAASDDSLDWGTLLIYTCRSSCHISGYVSEFVWKQNMSDRDVVDTK